MSQENLKITIVAGGTGGHIYPGIAIAEEIRARFPQAEILFLGSTEGLEQELVARAGFDIRLIRARALLRKLSYKALTAPFVSAWGFFQALGILRSFRPQALVSTGGYASLAAAVAARLLGIPVYVHEQNVLPGVTNKLCFRLARLVFLSFDESLAYHSGQVVGNPVRREILLADREAARKKLGLAAGKKLLLIMGGSQGARSINRAVTAALPRLGGDDWVIIHSIGARDFAPGDLPGYPFYRPFAYLYNMGEVLAAADLVISRAGATAIAEFAARGLPMVLVPFPYSAEGHQELNARAVADHGAGLMIRDADFTPARFQQLLGDKSLDLHKMSAAARRLARPQAAREIVNSIL